MKKTVYIPHAMIQDVLRALPIQGKKELEPLKSFTKEHGVPMNVLEDHEVTDNLAEKHMHMADFWYCLEGEAKFIYGGDMVDAYPKEKNGVVDEREWKSKEIIGGTKVTLHPGDWLFIPAGEPHQHFAEKTTRLVIIKIPDTPEHVLKHANPTLPTPR